MVVCEIGTSRASRGCDRPPASRSRRNASPNVSVMVDLFAEGPSSRKPPVANRGHDLREEIVVQGTEAAPAATRR
ncbi:hypothetical protein GTS_47940 [Gandjariella thermophila]|uniref:Uncharacterized protein n=1 Tax=Gandjariella thermophila TaxID=1931992 RepID=A0A4D4J918_9PSEU|nr:hypothetical protein GTS_47940 [Gandjariella thermophila]